MRDIFFFFPIALIFIIAFIAVAFSTAIKNSGSSSKSYKSEKNIKYTRQVHQMHIKDASDERKHRLEQLKSLYEAGMMERDEYNERMEAIEADYRGKY